jgi:hypothetical protein
MTSIIKAAHAYVACGWQPVPIPAGRKGPVVEGWQNRSWQPEDFDPDDNIGVILGSRSGHLVDGDLDCQEAVALAGLYLPQTSAIFGRRSKPRSHYLYIAPGAHTEAFADPTDGKMLVEL